MNSSKLAWYGALASETAVSRPTASTAPQNLTEQCLFCREQLWPGKDGCFETDVRIRIGWIFE